MAYRFKTREEFIRDDLWYYRDNVPERWNYAGNMNHYLGMTIPSEYESYCENKQDFNMGGWSFLSRDYVKIEEEKEDFNASDVLNQWVEAIVDCPFGTPLKKGDFLYVSSSVNAICLKGTTWAIPNHLSSKVKKTSPEFIPNGALKVYEKIVREKYPIGTQVTNHNLGFGCEFEVAEYAFSSSYDDSEIYVRGKTQSLYTVFKDGKWADAQTYFPDLSLHVGRYVKALVDSPFGGLVRAGDIGKIISESHADFPNFEWYSCSQALNKGSLGIKFELMPESYVPSAEEFKNSEKENEVDMLQIQEECKRRFPIGCSFIPIDNLYSYTLLENHATYKIDGNTIYAHYGAGLLYENGVYAQRILEDASCIDGTSEQLVDKIEKKESRKTSIVNVQTVDVELKSTKKNKIKFKF
jgi:hypothetical protein